MPDPSQQREAFLFVRKIATEKKIQDEHVRVLSKKLNTDGYQVRMNIHGDGLALLRKGPENEIKTYGQAVGDLGYQWGIAYGRPPIIRPLAVKQFSVHESGISFQGNFGTKELKKGDNLLLVLSGMKGNLLAHMVRKSSYSGKKSVVLSEEEKYEFALMSDPVLDLYILPDPFNLEHIEDIAPLRIIPGRFNPKSLEEEATTSGKQNLDNAYKMIKKMAGNAAVDFDFGFAQLPRCRFKTEETESSKQDNAKSLANYGWYLLHILAQSGIQDASHKFAGPMGALAEGASAITDQQATTVAAAGLAAAALGIDQTGANQNTSARDVEGDTDFLPAPPTPRQRKGFYGFSITIAIQIAVVLGYVLFIPMVAMMNKGFGNYFYFYGLQKGIFFHILAGIFFYGSFRYLRLKRYMENTPTSKARSIAVGNVEMSGTAQRAYNLISPISQLPCVYYRIIKYTRRTNIKWRGLGWRGATIRTKGAEQWTLVSDTDSGNVPFYIEDETGRVMIDPDGADVKTSNKTVYKGGMRNPWGVSMGISEDDKFIEHIIPEGKKVYVLGFAHPRHTEEVPLRQRVAEKLRMLKQDKKKLMKYDMNDDGQIDQSEWSVARADMEKKALEESLKEKGRPKKQEEQLIISKPEGRGLPFVISQTEEELLGKKYHLATIGCFVGAALCSVVGLVLLLV